MLTKPEIDTQWDTIKEAIQERWQTLGGEELDEARSSPGRLAGVIQQRTGERRDEIEAYLDLVANGDGWIAQQAVQKSVVQYPLSGIMVAFAGGFILATIVTASCTRSR